MSRALVLYAHPCSDSFNAAVYEVVLQTLADRGWQIDSCDLNAEGFSPVLTEQERHGYHEEPANIQPVNDYVERLRAADTLIIVYPVWNFGFPAILKGFFDRVFLPGVSFHLENGCIRPGLTNIRTLAACCTYGGNRFRAMLNADPPRKCFTRAIWYACGRPKTRYIALYDMNNNNQEQRQAHLHRVRLEMQKL
ncbi:MAG: NAD(P)H-dependent oxidoreductase [Granulosicoccus sp.]